MRHQFKLQRGTQIYVNGRFLFSVSPTAFSPDQTKINGESWIEMYNRTEPGRIFADAEAERLAKVILNALEVDSLRLEPK